MIFACYLLDQLKPLGTQIHREEQTTVGLTVNLLSKQICEGSAEMLRGFIRRCPGTSYGVESQFVAWPFLHFSDACSNASQMCDVVKLGV